MEISKKDWSLAPSMVRRAVALGVRWVGMTLVALALALLWLSHDLRPSGSHLADLVTALGFGGIISLAMGMVAWWGTDALRGWGIQFKLAIPAILAATIVGLNAVIAAKLMFISTADSQVLIGFMVFGAGVALALSSSLAWSLARALGQVVAGARRIAAGDLAARLPEGTAGIAELDALAQNFNLMATNVEQAFQQRDAADLQRRTMIAALSHDVRTPLASMRAMVEAIDDGVVSDPATVRRYQSAIRAEMRHLSALVEDLFEIASLEAGTLRMQREPLHIADLLSDALEAMHEQAERRGVRLEGKAEEELPLVPADARQCYRVLTNLMQNALHHTPAGGVIALRAHRAGPTVIVRVLDSGEGIAAHDLPHIFEPAYRGEPSRQRESELPARASGISGRTNASGTGLGLAIAHGIIRAHGGKIGVSSPLLPVDRATLCSWEPALAKYPGTAVWFSLPVATLPL